MIRKLVNYILSHEPFKPAHMGTWIRGMYFRHYLPRFVNFDTLKNTLDGACGNGQYVYLVSRWAPSAHVKGVDLKKSDDWGKFALPNNSFSTMDLMTLDEHEEEDLIVSIDTLEHIVNNKVVLQNFYNALRESGTLYLGVPCESDEFHIFPRSWFSPFHEWEDKEHIGEQRKLSELVALMKEMGFEILLARNTFTFWGTMAWEMEILLSWRGRLGNKLNIVLMPFYKLLGLLDLYVPIGGGADLVIARKPKTQKS